jgi:hypothetical protein
MAWASTGASAASDAASGELGSWAEMDGERERAEETRRSQDCGTLRVSAGGAERSWAEAEADGKPEEELEPETESEGATSEVVEDEGWRSGWPGRWMLERRLSRRPMSMTVSP